MAKEIKSGAAICQSGQPINSLHMILKGTVRVVYADGEFFLEKGDIIGLCEIYQDSYMFTYIASDDVSLASFPYKPGSLSTQFSKQPDFAQLITKSCLKQMKNVLEIYDFLRYDCDNLYHYLTETYDEYKNLCERYSISPRLLPDLEDSKPLTLEEDIPKWLTDYYENMAAILTGILPTASVPYADFLNGILMKTSEDIGKIMSVCSMMCDYKADTAQVLMNENRLDLFDIYTSLYSRIGHEQEDSTAINAAVSRMMINMEGFSFIDRKLYQSRVAEYKKHLANMETAVTETAPEPTDSKAIAEALAGSLNTILDYANCDAEVTTTFRKCITDYKRQIDKNATDDYNRKLRLTLTKNFYKIYCSAFKNSLTDSQIPTVVMMFFLFGYVDEELAGMDNAAYLYSIADRFPSDPDMQVYTIYEWLKAIYNGEKEPSRNEFDTDYIAYIHELKVSGKISAAQEREMADDNMEKVMFELANMFPLVNKITFGRLSTFCPVFSEHNVLKDLEQAIVTDEKITETITKIRNIDFGAYFRETIYSNPEGGVAKEFVNVEILPDIILMPNVGIRGVMWQEIEGKRRTTPARMMTSVFQLEDLNATIARLTGEFRWEMCKRIQGARWNDVSERSLTSEYFEYIQFFKKNRDLTPEAKDKIRAAMQKAKNSYKEMFVRDYITWVIYEGNGSPRLNKVARNIVFTYCPFSKEIRTKLKTNPLYKDILERYDIRTAQKLHHMDNLYQKLENGRYEIPKEIAVQRKFLES